MQQKNKIIHLSKRYFEKHDHSAKKCVTIVPNVPTRATIDNINGKMKKMDIFKKFPIG
jgi:hypothetical protein